MLLVILVTFVTLVILVTLVTLAIYWPSMLFLLADFATLFFSNYKLHLPVIYIYAYTGFVFSHPDYNG